MSRLAALQQESEEKKELVKKKSDSISSSIITFSHAVIAIENEIASNDALFLKVGRLIHYSSSEIICHQVIFVCFFLFTELQ